MTIASPEQQFTRSVSDKGQAYPLNARRNMRRRRSTIGRHVRRMQLLARQYRTGLLLILAGFIFVSIKNGVLFNDNNDSAFRQPERPWVLESGTAPSLAARPIPSQRDILLSEPNNTRTAVFTPQPRQVRPDRALHSQGVTTSRRGSDTASHLLRVALDARMDSSIVTKTYVVNEGGSLWRTAKRFIRDSVVIDRMMDSLAANGLDVNEIRPGLEILVTDLDGHSRRVQIQVGAYRYESLILGHTVTTTVTTSVQQESFSRNLPASRQLVSGAS